MMHITPEGEVIKPGFNFYPLGSSQLGVRIRGRKRVVRLRFSFVVWRLFWSIS